MAYTQTLLPGGLGQWAGLESDIDTTPRENVRGGPTTLIAVMGLSPTSVCSLKIWDSDGVGLTAGTTPPDWIIPLPASDQMVTFDPPLEFKNGLCFAGATEDGTTCTTAPSGTTPIYFIGKD